MREELLGYLLEALEPDERASVEERLRHDAKLQQELELLHESLEPLRADTKVFEPPVGLALRTCTLIDRNIPFAPQQPKVAISASSSSSNSDNFFRGSWSLADLAVAAAIFLAATTLLFPAIQHSRSNARIAGCQNNLRQLGTSLAQYSNMNGNYFPSLPTEGSLSAAGLYAVQLAEKELLPNEQLLVCPNTVCGTDAEPFHVPTRAELESASGSRLVKLLKQMGGSYGYNLGFMQDGEYHSVRNQGRPTFALMADTPSIDLEGRQSKNHGSCGQNVLFEDGHVCHLSGCSQGEELDHIYLNDKWMMAAGTHADDSSIGHSYASPF